MTSKYICLCLKIGVRLQTELWILGQGVGQGGPLGTCRVEKASQALHLPEPLWSLEQECSPQTGQQMGGGARQRGQPGTRACESGQHLSATLKFWPLSPFKSGPASALPSFSPFLYHRTREDPKCPSLDLQSQWLPRTSRRNQKVLSNSPVRARYGPQMQKAKNSPHIHCGVISTEK